MYKTVKFSAYKVFLGITKLNPIRKLQQAKGRCEALFERFVKLFEKERNVLELIVSPTFGCSHMVKELWLLFTLRFYKNPLPFIFVDHNNEYIPEGQLKGDDIR